MISRVPPSELPVKPEPERRSAAFQPLLSLGSGGMGTAWLCRALGTGEFERLVVVKRPHPHVVERHDAMLRFIDEARLTGSIHHVNVVATHQVGEDEVGPFIVLEYIEGASLEELVRRAGVLGEQVPVPVAMRIALDALSGLEAVHTARDHAGRPLNILHRDISLQNLLVGADGVCRVADFGAAKSDVRKYSTDQRYLLGKLLYLPPEYLRRDETGSTLDVYSLGITLWHTLTGVELWQDQSEAQVVACIIEGRVPKVSEYVAVPPEVDALVAKATRAQPAERFQSAQLMAEAIEALGRDLRLLGTHSEVSRWTKRLMADELSVRRERIAEARSQLATAEVHEAETVAPPPVKSRRWVPIVALTGLGTLAALAALLVSRDRTEAPAADATIADSFVSPAPPRASHTPDVPDPNPLVKVAPELAPVPVAETPASAAEPPAESPASSSRKSAPPRPAPARASSKAPRASTLPTAPDTITERNPYR